MHVVGDLESQFDRESERNSSICFLHLSLSSDSFSYRRDCLGASSPCAKMAACEVCEGATVCVCVRFNPMIYMPILEKGVFRFDCSDDDRVAALPSMSFADPRVREIPVLNRRPPSYIPTFERAPGQPQVVNIKFEPGTNFYGTGEVSGPLERSGKRVVTWNTDSYAYGPETTSLYQSHPWVLAVLPDGRAMGVLADTTRRCEIDLRKELNVKFSAEPCYPVITFGPFASPSHVLISLSHAIGTVFMPPKWFLGYHQCRWSYASDERVREIAKKFREKGIPCDAIWMDIDYMDGFRCFTFDKDRFPDPKSLAKDLHQDGFKAVWMLDPGIKHETGYAVHQSGSEKDIWVRTADEKPFVGEVWPGQCVFPDFTQSKTRAWWANLVKDFSSNGVDGLWNDMNEPAVFKTQTKTMPENNIHLGDEEFGGRQIHSHYHNVYGMLMARSTYEGMKLADGDRRPVVLTRAGFVGSQRYAATWTGDNVSSWEHLHMSIPMVLQLGLSGQPLSGPDIGGFINNATPKLFRRWMGIGSFFPFCRGHSDRATINHEPWYLGKECEEVCRLALQRRYRLLPHIYTLFYMAHTKGIPVATPIFFADPQDAELRTREDSFMLGPLLIYASTQEDQKLDHTQHRLPNGIWLSFDFEDPHPDLPTMYLKGGSIIPAGHPYQHVGESNPTDELSLLVALDQHGKAEGILFEDDGDGYEYKKGGYLLTTYVAQLGPLGITVRISKTEGSRKRPNRRLHVILLLCGGAKLHFWGMDGDIIHFRVPFVKGMDDGKCKFRMENSRGISTMDSICGNKGLELLKTPVLIKRGAWALNVVPLIGGRIISMEHIPSGTQWLHSQNETGGYEEYVGIESQPVGCTEEYNVIDFDLGQAEEVESLKLEAKIGDGLVLRREISVPENDPKTFRIESTIVAWEVGAGSGGYSRVACLRVHPTFSLLHPTESYVVFTSIDGSEHEIGPESGTQEFEGDLLPKGEWMLVDKHVDWELVNRFNTDEVFKCVIDWGAETVTLELQSEERPVSDLSPIKITHEYEVRSIV